MTTIDSVTNGVWGYTNIGQYTAEMDIWAPFTADDPGLSLKAGSTTVTGFSSTADILPGMSIFSYPDNIGNNPWPTVVSVGANSIVMSAPSLITSTNEDLEFGLVNNGIGYNQTITTPSTTSPNGTVITWSYPNFTNDSDVYAYPHITYGNDPGYTSTTGVPSLEVSAVTNLSVTYNISVSAATNPNNYDCLIETFATSIPNPTDGTTAVDEISFMAHTPPELASFVLSLSNHFNYSSGGLNAYIAVVPYATPQIIIMPVTTPGGTTPLDMISGTYTVQLAPILAALVKDGVLSSSSYIDNYQAGFEIVEGSGSATINSLSYDWNAAGPPPPPPPPPVVLPPVIAITSHGGAVTQAAQTVVGTVDTADNGTTVTVLDGATVVGTTTVANGAWSDNITLTGTGLNVLTATDTNAGGTGTSNAVDYTLALPPPPPPPPTPPHAPTISGSLSSKDIETLSGKAPDGSVVTVFEGTTKLGTTIASASGAWHYATTKLADGHYDFDASDTLSGLTSALSNTVDVTVGTVGHGHHNSSDFGH